MLNWTLVLVILKKFPLECMQIGWMENDFRNPTAKVWANLDNPIKNCNFSKFWLISCISPSQVALCYVMSQQYNSLMELYKNFKKKSVSWKCIFPLLLYLGMLGLRWLCMQFMTELDQLVDYISKKKNSKIVKTYVQSRWRFVLLCYDHRFWQSYCLERAT